VCKKVAAWVVVVQLALTSATLLIRLGTATAYAGTLVTFRNAAVSP
jgi:hypothetical protein